MSETETVRRKAGRPAGSKNKVKALKASKPKSSAARMKEYLQLPQLAANDIVQIQNMVAMEDEMESLRNLLKNEKDALKIRKLTESQALLSKEYRLVQDQLGISRNQRSTEIDMQSEVDKLVDEATVLVEQSGVEISCHFCTSEFEMGWVIFHFRDNTPWQFSFDCPKCGKLNTISSSREIETVDGHIRPGRELSAVPQLAAPAADQEPGPNDLRGGG